MAAAAGSSSPPALSTDATSCTSWHRPLGSSGRSARSTSRAVSSSRSLGAPSRRLPLEGMRPEAENRCWKSTCRGPGGEGWAGGGEAAAAGAGGGGAGPRGRGRWRRALRRPTCRGRKSEPAGASCSRLYTAVASTVVSPWRTTQAPSARRARRPVSNCTALPSTTASSVSTGVPEPAQASRERDGRCLGRMGPLRRCNCMASRRHWHRSACAGCEPCAESCHAFGTRE
jgi:hypothetical protein